MERLARFRFARLLFSGRLRRGAGVFGTGICEAEGGFVQMLRG
jgi:hypothetical protein